MRKLTFKQAKWICYQLKLRKLIYRDIANRAGLSCSIVNEVLNCRRSSIRVFTVLVSVLGYESLFDLLKDANNAT